MAEKVQETITVVIVQDTFIRGKHVAAGTEKTYELGEPDEKTGMVEPPEELAHLKAAGRVVEKGTKGHEQWLAQQPKPAKSAEKK